MPNSHHLDMLAHGVKEWNKWREDSPRVLPDLEGADLAAIASDFSGINLRNANLRKARLSGVSLANGNLYDARLNEAELVDADVRGADLRGTDFSAAIVDGIRYDRGMKCLGARVDTCTGSPRFRRAVIEADYIEAFIFEHPFLSRAWSWTSDYSRSPMRIGLVGLMIIGLFAAIYYIFPAEVYWPGAAPAGVLPRELWFAPVYYSVVTFTTLGYGDIHPATTSGEMLAVCEVLIGYVWLGYLISVLALRASARV